MFLLIFLASFLKYKNKFDNLHLHTISQNIHTQYNYYEQIYRYCSQFF